MMKANQCVVHAAPFGTSNHKEATMSDRWSIYFDIEGFSALWDGEDQVLWSLGEMMRAIFRLGRLCYPREPDRLFAHQFGDGFLVVSDFHEKSLERCATVAIAVMRHVAASGRLVRAAISEGELSDIKNCYPREVLDCLEGDHTVGLHMGVMTISPVMGTALIRAVSIDKIAPSGPLLTAHSSMIPRLGPSIPYSNIVNTELVSIDWVHMCSELLTTLQEKASLTSPSPSDLDATLRRYCQEHPVHDEWRSNVYDLLQVPHKPVSL